MTYSVFISASISQLCASESAMPGCILVCVGEPGYKVLCELYILPFFRFLEEPATSGVDSMEESSDECNSDVSVSDTDSVYVPTPERPVAIKVSRTDLPNGVTIMEVSQLEKFVESINKVRRCVTPHCVGELIPVKFNSSGLGGAMSLSYACSVCAR